jgi:hypothetical protein
MSTKRRDLVSPENDDGVDCDDDMKRLVRDADDNDGDDDEIDFTRDRLGNLGTSARQIEFLESAVASSNPKDDDKFMAKALLS